MNRKQFAPDHACGMPENLVSCLPGQDLCIAPKSQIRGNYTEGQNGMCVCVCEKDYEARVIVPALKLFSIHSCLWAISAPEPGWRRWGSGVEMASWTDINTLPSAHWPRACANPSSRDGHVTRRGPSRNLGVILPSKDSLQLS